MERLEVSNCLQMKSVFLSLLNWVNNFFKTINLYASFASEDGKQMLSRLYVAIGLITLFGAILTGRQSGQTLQCLYGNPMANNFFQN